MQKITLPLVEMTMTNFKCYENKTIKFDPQKVNEIFGPNASGKTSIAQALQFSFFGSKRDVHKISTGKTSMQVSTTLSDGQNEIVVTSRIENDKYHCSVFMDGKKVKSPSTFIKQLLGLDSFDPRQLLSAKNENFLSLLNIKFSPELFSKFPKEVLEQVNLQGNSFDEINKLKKAMEQERQLKYREKKQKESSYNEMMDALAKEEAELSEKHGQISSLKTEAEYEKEISKVKQAYLIDRGTEEKEMRERIKNSEEKINKLIREKEKEIEELSNKKQKYFDDQHAEFRVYVERKEKDENTLISEIKRKQILAQTVEGLSKRKTFIKKLETEWDKVKDEYDHLQHLIKVELKNIVSTLIKPVSDYIPELSYDSEIDSLTYQGKIVSELSQSESINLAIRLMSLKDPNSLIVCDNMECFDPKKIHDVDWGKLNALILRVGQSPILKNSNPIQTGGQHE